MKKMLLLLMVLSSRAVSAQDIVSIIKEAVTKVIRAVDLEIQRIQTQTIVLQEAQKEVENAMSALRLDEIRGWVEQQKDLYAGYFQELEDVKTVISDYHKVKEIIKQGELFGQFSLERSNLHGEFAQAYRDDVSLCSFNIDDFERLLKSRPDLALRYSKQVGAKLRNIENRLINLLNKDVRTRLIHFLWQLVEQNLGENTAEGFCMPNYLTHEDIASLIGSSRQTVTTLINELEGEGILSYNRQEICFMNVKKLQKLVAEN